MENETFAIMIVSLRDLSESSEILFEGEAGKCLNNLFAVWLAEKHQEKNLGISNDELSLSGFVTDMFCLGVEKYVDLRRLKEEKIAIDKAIYIQ